MKLLEAFMQGVGKAVAENWVAGLVTLLSLAIAGAGLYIAYRQYIGWREEKASGPVLDLILYRHPGIDKATVFLPFREHTVFAFPVIIGIANFGNRTAHDVEIVCESNNTVISQDAELNSPIAAAMGVVAAQDQGATEHKTRAYRKLSSIPPTGRNSEVSAYELCEFAGARGPTIFDKRIPFETKDKVPMSGRLIATYCMVLEISVSCRDVPPIRKTYSLSYRNGSCKSLEENVQEEVERVLSIKQERDAISASEKIHEPQIVVMFEKFEKIHLAEDMPDGTPELLEASHRSIQIGITNQVL